jgi:hypothetical protein
MSCSQPGEERYKERRRGIQNTCEGAADEFFAPADQGEGDRNIQARLHKQPHPDRAIARQM